MPASSYHLELYYMCNSTVAMELTQPLNASIHTRKRSLEAEEEELVKCVGFMPQKRSTKVTTIRMGAETPNSQ